MSKKVRTLCCLVGLLGLLGAVTMKGDGTLQGTLAVKVVDDNGQPLPGVTVDIVSSDKGFQRSLTSDRDGAVTFALLQPGPYVVRASLSGFQGFEADRNVVSADRTTALRVTLRLAAAKETVVVTGETPLVDRTNASDTTVVSSTLTDKLAVGRGFQNLITFAPGVIDPT